MKGRLAIVLEVLMLICMIYVQPTTAWGELQVDLTRFTVCVRSGHTVESAQAWNPTKRAWRELRKTGSSLFEVPHLSFFNEKGEARLRFSAPVDGIYILGKYTSGRVDYDSQEWLRYHSIAYKEGHEMPRRTEIIVSHNSHQVWRRLSNGYGHIHVNGESRHIRFNVRTRDQLAEYDSREQIYRDQWGNPLKVKAKEIGDRIRFNVTYKIENPRNTWNDIRIVFWTDFRNTFMQTLTWGRDKDKFTSIPLGPECSSVFCENPFIIVRGDRSAYLGFLDHDQSNLFFRAKPNEASVEYWAWLNTIGKKYFWTFEVIPGYGAYPNAFLRALNPHTKNFRRKIEGHISYQWGMWRPKEAAKAGVRIVYYNAWYMRNGRYFDLSVPLDKEYKSIVGIKRSYRQIINDIQKARERNIKVYMYTQFAGISEDIIRDFESSMIRDSEGNTIVAGEDGVCGRSGELDPCHNIWANPNPNLPYGASFLKQVKTMLPVFNCGGIGLDRTDRLDNSYTKGIWDLAHFDGSATPYLIEGEHRPCSSIALQGKRLWLKIRDLLDRKRALLIANCPRTLVVNRLADAVKADIVHSPWNSFFLRAMSNGKTMFVQTRPDIVGKKSYERNNYVWTGSSGSLGNLIQAYSLIEIGSAGRIRQLEAPKLNTRLLYIIPSGSPYPRYWVFEKGGALLNYNHSAGAEAASRYAGSIRTR